MRRSQMFTATEMELEYPLSLGVYDDYVKAEHAADYLADQGFPVQNLLGALFGLVWSQL